MITVRFNILVLLISVGLFTLLATLDDGLIDETARNFTTLKPVDYYVEKLKVRTSPTAQSPQNLRCLQLSSRRDQVVPSIRKATILKRRKKVLFFAKYDEGDDHPLPRKLLDELKLRQYCENSLYTAECLHRRYILEVVTRRGQKPFEENLAFIEQFRAKIGEQCSEVVNPWEFVDDEPLLEDCLTLVDSGSPVVEALLQRLFRRQLEEEEELRLDREFFLRFAERFSTLFRSTLFFYVILKVVKLCLHLCGYV
ncbi:hypothetical protein TYRP_005320 [Tyrophagus putrescentiae]|nr:hypothetical protein TYRP_005320 [Tyrophagus putrescentiae]